MNLTVMRFLFVTFFLLSFSTAFSQIKIGLKLNPGLAWYRSPKMDDMFSSLNGMNSQKQFQNRSVAGVQLGIGGYGEYIKSSKLMFVTELTFNYQNTPYFIYSDDDQRDVNGTGDRTEVESNAKIKGFYLSIPIMTKYVFLERQKIYGIGGFAFNLMFKPKIISREQTTYTSYVVNEIVTSPNVVDATINAKMDGAGMFNTQFILGAGKSFRFAGKSMDIEFRYQMPLLKTNMVTSDQYFRDNTDNNVVFSKEGRDVLGAFTGVNVNDFRNGVFMFSIRYQFKYIEGKE